jgi:hypothetical protein
MRKMHFRLGPDVVRECDVQAGERRTINSADGRSNQARSPTHDRVKFRHAPVDCSQSWNEVMQACVILSHAFVICT